MEAFRARVLLALDLEPRHQHSNNAAATRKFLSSHRVIVWKLKLVSTAARGGPLWMAGRAMFETTIVLASDHIATRGEPEAFDAMSAQRLMKLSLGELGSRCLRLAELVDRRATGALTQS